METSDRTIAIILASGSGSRFGAELPKQFCQFLGRPLLMHTIDSFAKVLPHDNIIVVIDSKMEALWKKLCRESGYESPRIVFGGDTRTESLAKALQACDGADDNITVMIHDGARPLVSERLIRRAMTIPDGFAGVVPAIAVTDTLRELDEYGDSSTVDRSRYVAVQTPQTFLLGTLRKSFEDYTRHSVTDDATMVQRVTGRKIAIVEGDTCNIKVTNPMDIAIAEAIYQAVNGLQKQNID